MSDSSQISAYIPKQLNDRLDLYARETGIKKGRLVEEALEAHMDALDELPPDVIVPTRITLTAESLERLAERMEAPPAPTPALVRLMRGRG